MDTRAISNSTRRSDRAADRATSLPAPDRSHATCPWCGGRFAGISRLLDHVDTGHLGAPALAA